MKKVDYIIVGQGLAGSTLALQLLDRGKSIVVYDLPDENRSSKVAAGLFNPVTGKKWVKTWKANTLFPYAERFYSAAEKKLNASFYHSTAIYRPFPSLDIQNDWIAKAMESDNQPFIANVHTRPIDEDIVHNPLGGIELKCSGYVDIKAFLIATRAYLVERGAYFPERYDVSQMVVNDRISYGGITASKVVFCQGASAIPSMWEFLPFRFVKGEILLAKWTENIRKIYNQRAFVLPTGNGFGKMGATYEYHNYTGGPSEKGKKQILEKVERFFFPKFEIVGHESGVRPATLDRRPFLGVHPEAKNIVIFNGLGAKGVTLAPYFSEVLTDFLEHERELEREVDIKRYHTK